MSMKTQLRSPALGFFLLLCFACSAWSTVDAQEDPCVTQRNTREINACVKQQLDVAEAELNAAYKEVLARLAKPDGLGRPQDGVRARLVEAQRHWIQFREKNCDALLMQEADGSARSSQYMGCKRELAQQRTEQLRRWFLPQ